MRTQGRHVALVVGEDVHVGLLGGCPSHCLWQGGRQCRAPDRLVCPISAKYSSLKAWRSWIGRRLRILSSASLMDILPITATVTTPAAAPLWRPAMQ